MARRSEDWNVGLAEDLRDATFAREFLLAAIDEGVDLQIALGKVIRAMGVKEFASESGADQAQTWSERRMSGGPASPKDWCRHARSRDMGGTMIPQAAWTK